MEQFSDDNSSMDPFPGTDRRAMSPTKGSMSTKASAFSIAAIIGGDEEENTANRSPPPIQEEQTGAQIAPLGKN